MTIQDLIDMLNWFPVSTRNNDDFCFVAPNLGKKEGVAHIKSLRYFPETDSIEIEIESD